MKKIIEIRKEAGCTGNIFFRIYLDNVYTESFMDYKDALIGAEDLEKNLISPFKSEVLYTKEIEL